MNEEICKIKLCPKALRQLVEQRKIVHQTVNTINHEVIERA